MPWFYNSHSGDAASESGVAALAYEAALHTGTGWHEYPTQAAMLAAIKANGWPAPTGVLGGLGNAGKGAAGAAGNAVTGGITDLLTQRTLWVRIVKVVLGLGLVVIGIIQLAGPSRAAGTIVKAAVA